MRLSGADARRCRRAQPRGRSALSASKRRSVAPDRPEMTFTLAGDQIYVDAYILKWTPMANVLGLHTADELDRVAGRYDDIAQETPRPERTIFRSARRGREPVRPAAPAVRRAGAAAGRRVWLPGTLDPGEAAGRARGPHLDDGLPIRVPGRFENPCAGSKKTKRSRRRRRAGRINDGRSRLAGRFGRWSQPL